MKYLEEVLAGHIARLLRFEEMQIKSFPAVVTKISSPQFLNLSNCHLKQTLQQKERLHAIQRIIGVSPSKNQILPSILIEEPLSLRARVYDLDVQRDIELVGALRHIEHYEISLYEDAIALAQHIDLDQIAATLQSSIDEEYSYKRELSIILQDVLLDTYEESVNPHFAELFFN